MTVAEKILRAKTDIDAVYEAGKAISYDSGYTDGKKDGYASGNQEGFAKGAELVNRTLFGAYILKKTPDISGKDLLKYRFIEDFTGKGVYAHFVNSHTPSYIYTTVDKITLVGYDYGDYEKCEFRLVNVKNGKSTALHWDHDFKSWVINYEFGDWYEDEEHFSAYDGGILPDSQGRIIVFTEPLVVSQELYDAFKLITDNGTSDFITSDATARASDITRGKTAYGLDGKITGTANTPAESEAQGAENEKKRWWGIYQDNGNRTSWNYGFGGWYVDSIDPQFDVRPTGASSMFPNVVASNGKNLSLPEIEARNGIVFDFSKCTNFTNFIAWGATEDLGFVDTTSATTPIFQYCSSLKRLSIAIKADGSQNFSTAFESDSGLEELTIDSGVFGSNLNFQWATKLKKASVTSIVEHLSDTTSGLSVTFSKEILNQTSFDFESGIKYPVWSSGEWEALIATKPNWRFNLI